MSMLNLNESQLADSDETDIDETDIDETTEAAQSKSKYGWIVGVIVLGLVGRFVGGIFGQYTYEAERNPVIKRNLTYAIRIAFVIGIIALGYYLYKKYKKKE